MLRQALRIHFEIRTNYLASYSKRFKGHSHWQNTRHIKEEKDIKKSIVVDSYLRKMQGAINAKSGDFNPASNSTLASIIEDAKKDCVPSAIIQRFLQRWQEKSSGPPAKIYLRGSNNFTLAITYDSKKNVGLRQGLKKARSRYGIMLKEINSVQDVFESKGFIVSKAPSADITAAKAEEDAIIAGAEEVEELETADKGEKVFQFTTLHDDMWTAVKALKEMGWTMYEHKHILVTTVCVNAPEEELEKLYEVYTYIESLPEVDSIVANMA